MYMVLYPCVYHVHPAFSPLFMDIFGRFGHQCFNCISRPNSINFVRSHFGRIIAEATLERPSASVNTASLTPPAETSVNLPLDAYKASALPGGINLMQLTINGPRSTTLRDIEIAIAEGKHLCFHLLKEEYDHLPKSIMQPDGEGVIIISEANQASLIRNLEGDL